MHKKLSPEVIFFNFYPKNNIIKTCFKTMHCARDAVQHTKPSWENKSQKSATRATFSRYI